MKYAATLLTATALLLHQQSTGAFAPPLQWSAAQKIQRSTTERFSSTAGETDVERLLRQAAELRAQAAEDEHQLHSSLTQKIKKHDEDMDSLIGHLFFSAPGGSLVDRLKSKRLSMDTLTDIIDRLHKRELVASGIEYVDSSEHEDRTEFRRVVVEPDDAEMQRLDGLLGNLIDAVAVLDKEFMAQKETKGELYVSHTEEQHFGGGNSAKRLRQHYDQVKREYEDQYQKRQQELHDAQKVKKGNKPPPKQKDININH
jgi:Skp family chaperone for outer membrane proteins